ncbi:MAG TPA: hypothetical protein V6D08_11015 [Candidatus Obscuribacterales bacterium]
MDAIAYIMLVVFLLAGLSFALSLAARLSSLTGGKPHTAYWATIFGGAGFLFLSGAGFLSLRYLEASQRGFLPVIAAMFLLTGALLIRSGLRSRRAATK